MKKLIVLLVFTCVVAWGYSQEDKNNVVRDLKETMAGIGNSFANGEVFETMSKFSYGFLKQGVNTAVGIGSAVIELPSNLVVAFKEYSDVNSKEFLYWGEYTLETIGEFMYNTYQKIDSGDPESMGEAFFDTYYILGSGAETVYAGRYLASKYGLKYHYTTAEGAKSIQKTGIKLNSEGEAFVTHDGGMSGPGAKSGLALNKEPTHKIILDKSIEGQKMGKVKRANGQPGGGFEQVFYEEIPADKIIAVEPVPKELPLTDKVARVIGESSNSLASYSTPIVSPVIAKENNQNSNEGGHKLNARINIVVFLEESISPGKLLFFEKDDIKFIGINSVDIAKLTPQFYQKLSGDKCDFDYEDEKASDGNRSREEAIPSESRTQRGL